MKTIIWFTAILLFLILWPDFFTKSWIPFILDSIFYPIYHFQPFFSQTLWWHLRDLMVILFGYIAYSKFYILFTQLVWAFLWYKVWNIVSEFLKVWGNEKVFLIILTISFVLLNPFSYERWITQVGILMAVYFIWLWLVYLIDFILKWKSKLIYLSSLFFGIAFTIMPHTIVFVTIIWIISLIFFFKKFSIKQILISLWIFLLLNLNWLVWTLFLQDNWPAQTIKNFNQINIEVFTSNTLKPLNVEFTNLLLYWFWWEKYHHLKLPEWRWYIAWFFIFFIILLWIYQLFKTNKRLTFYLISLWIISYVLALWISSDIFKPFNMLLYDHIPFYIWMREPWKLIWLLMIIYAIFFTFWNYFIIKEIKKIDKKWFNYWTVWIFVFLIILSWSRNILLAYNGQLFITNYPKDIFKSKDFISNQNLTWKIIIFPWHSYLACAWTRWKIISNPVPYILNNKNIVSAKNIEISKLYSNNVNNYDKWVFTFLKTKDISYLKNLWINYIYWQKYCADFKTYDFLDNSKNLQKIFSWNFINIYKIK